MPQVVAPNDSKDAFHTALKASRLPLREEPASHCQLHSFMPEEPASLQQAGLTDTQVESLILKYLLHCGVARGNAIARQICIPFGLLADELRRMKQEQLVVYKGSAGLNDYEYELTSQGHERALRHMERGTYFGSAPVPLQDYIDSVAAQSPAHERPTPAHLESALGELLIDRELFSQVGQALCSVRALFLYGPPGNGKTSIAERLTAALGARIWVPRTVTIDGEIVRLFDPTSHEEIPIGDNHEYNRVDRRWVLIRRPTIVVGGELRLENLELRRDGTSGLMEAPVQMKSNCGTLVVDDFGRQQVSTIDLLNRWIVPLEKRYDFLNTPTGKKIRVPFEQLIVFATNLEPRHLVDEAFLRRIPYKIEVQNPSEEQFRKLFRDLSPKYGIEHREETVDYLLDTHYRKQSRPLRFCHARDLLVQVRNRCEFHGYELKLTPEAVDAAAKNYFSGL